ncbi:helix-turn-helix transcriptional regulator [Corynebacterium glaucum]|uniref:helix-turn-helix transcriptional regulator n=1 Tax=Corynebacterium glaucum TaxID=187491 RepID=UPI002658F831|nr:helix-turn-helix domain-containing protein [Corynebacterium glaucum]
MKLPTTPAISLSEAASLLGIGRSTAYNYAREGNFPVPVFRVGSRYVVPTRPLLEALGLNREEGDL